MQRRIENFLPFFGCVVRESLCLVGEEVRERGFSWYFVLGVEFTPNLTPLLISISTTNNLLPFKIQHYSKLA